MDVGGADVVDQVVHHRTPGAGAQALGPRSDHELGRLLDVGERGHRGSHIVSPQFAVRPAERDEQAALPFEVGAGLPIRARDVDPDQLPARPVREPGGPAHEQLASFAAEGDDDALASAVRHRLGPGRGRVRPARRRGRRATSERGDGGFRAPPDGTGSPVRCRGAPAGRRSRGRAACATTRGSCRPVRSVCPR